MAHMDEDGPPVEETPFAVPKVFLNAGGWGPTADNEPEQFKVGRSVLAPSVVVCVIGVCGLVVGSGVVLGEVVASSSHVCVCRTTQPSTT